MNRRRFGAIVLFSTLISGCTFGEDTESESTPTDSATETKPIDQLLPEEDSNWRINEKRQYSWGAIGADRGVIGIYDNSDGAEFHVLIMDLKEQYNVSGKATDLYCNVGWQVVLPKERFVFAASTGTNQREQTPEAPPTIARTPIPETNEKCIDLLGKSPNLDVEEVTSSRITDSDCKE